MNPFRVFVCENQPIVVEGIVRVLDRCSDLELVGHASEIDTVVQEAATCAPDLLLLGQPPTTKSVLPLLAKVREAGLSGSIVLWVTELSDMDSFRALQMGARGVVTRMQSADVLLECLRCVGRGTVWLEASVRQTYATSYRRNSTVRITRREREIIEFICRGMKNKEIAEALSITAGTVKVHLMHIFEKTGVKDRFQLALQGRQILGAAEPEAARAVLQAAAEA